MTLKLTYDDLNSPEPSEPEMVENTNPEVMEPAESSGSDFSGMLREANAVLQEINKLSQNPLVGQLLGLPTGPEPQPSTGIRQGNSDRNTDNPDKKISNQKLYTFLMEGIDGIKKSLGPKTTVEELETKAINNKQALIQMIDQYKHKLFEKDSKEKEVEK